MNSISSCKPVDKKRKGMVFSDRGIKLPPVTAWDIHTPLLDGLTRCGASSWTCFPSGEKLLTVHTDAREPFFTLYVSEDHMTCGGRFVKTGTFVKNPPRMVRINDDRDLRYSWQCFDDNLQCIKLGPIPSDVEVQEYADYVNN